VRRNPTVSETVHMLCWKKRELYTTVVLFTVREAGDPLDGHEVHIQVYRWVGELGLFWLRSAYAEEVHDVRTGTYAICSARLIWNKLTEAGYVLPPPWMNAFSLSL
jgi:hypothetical protein